MTNLKLVILFALVISVWSCQKEQLIPEQERVSASTDQITHEKCILEGALLDDPNQADERHRTLTNLFPLRTGGCFNVFINSNCSNLYRQATLGAIDEFNNVPNTSLEFTVVNSVAAADIIVNCQDLGGGNCNGGRADPGNPITVQMHTGINNTSCFCAPQNIPINQCHIQFIAMHEIGHAIGFGHTNSASLPLIPGTPVNDFFSIFNSGGMPNALCAGICTFTPADINAIQILYPQCYCHCILGDPDIYYEEFAYEADCGAYNCWEPYCNKVCPDPPL